MQEMKRCLHHKIVRSKNESERRSGQLELILLKSRIKYAIKKSSASYFCERKVECKALLLVSFEYSPVPEHIGTLSAQKPTAVVLFSLVQLSSFVIQVHCLIELNPHVFGSRWKEATFVGSLTVLVIVCDLKWVHRMVE